jgi:hypothetical protein
MFWNSLLPLFISWEHEYCLPGYAASHPGTLFLVVTAVQMPCFSYCNTAYRDAIIPIFYCSTTQLNYTCELQRELCVHEEQTYESFHLGKC